ncbi:MAG TPA: OmpH family outer membrane protein, partial [Sphingomicrobium sp.]|nr:OmpH family outer membrane protein [Sphingomicrobium sp.]
PTAAPAQRAPAAVVVIVDTDSIYRDCTACKSAQSQLQSRVQALKTRQKTLADQLRPEGQSIQTAIQALNGKEPDAALTKRIKDFQQKEQQANEELAKAQQNLQSIQANIVRQIEARLRPVINQVMTQRGANLALDVDNTLAHVQATDVTAAVLAGLNAALPSVSLTPLPQQPQQQQPQGR